MAESDDDLPTKLVINQPYDECLEVPDAEEIASVYTPTPREKNTNGGTGNKPRGAMEPSTTSMKFSDDDESQEDTVDDTPKGMPPSMMPDKGRSNPLGGGQKPRPVDASGDDEDDLESTDDDEDDDTPEGAYDPAEYEHLKVDSEVKEIFRYITKYTPQSLDLEFKLRPFIPEYIPAVGDIDAFLKVPKPDGDDDFLGLKELDEPTADQSDPSVLHHRLQAFSKLKKQRDAKVTKIDSMHDPRGVKDLDSWLSQMSDLTTSLPSQSVHYTKPMPDIDSLMREWPDDFEEALKNVDLPTADLDCDLETYIDIICATLDIPVHEKNGKPSRLQALHVLFNLYLEVKNSSFFENPQ